MALDTNSSSRGGGGGEADGLPEEPPSKPAGARAVHVSLRALHIVSMGLVLGGLYMGGTHDTLFVPIVLTVVSGLLLLAAMVAWGLLGLKEGAGWGLYLKLGLLGMGFLFTDRRLELYIAATAVTSIASHMSGAWRHFPRRMSR